jgi:uncharacterized damage-inducible protein DinB
METPLEYKARILKLMEGKDSLEVLRATPSRLATLIADVPDDALRKRPSPEKWSVGEILVHLAEAEVGAFWRYRQIIEHDGIALSAFAQDLWAELGHYSACNARESLELFRLLRAADLRMLDNLTEDQWQRKGIHAERGPMTVRDLSAQIAGHDLNHVAQVRQILNS